MKTILITGGAGFIGSHFIRHWLKKHPDFRAVNLDKLTYSGNLANLSDVRKDLRLSRRYVFVKGDVADPKKVGFIFKKYKPDYLAHFAAESIPAETYIPIYSSVSGTDLLTFGELWEKASKNRKIEKTRKGEAIFFNKNSLKALSFLNGGQWMPIRAVTRHRYKGEIVRLKQKFGIIEATPNHSVYSSNLELKNPVHNPELLVIRGVNELKKKYKAASKKLLEFLAAYITEGNATFNKANGGYVVEISQKKFRMD